MSTPRFRALCDANAGERAVLQGNLAFALGCARGGIHVVDGYPGTPSTEVIDRGLQFIQDRMKVGWSVNEANAISLAFGATMVGADAVATMKIPGLFQGADAVSTAAYFTCPRGALILYIASDFAPSSTQHVIDPRYFLKSCFIPVLEPRTIQEMMEFVPIASELARRHKTPVAFLASGLLCHSEGLVTLQESLTRPYLEVGTDFTRFMNLPDIARRNYQTLLEERMPELTAFAEQWTENRLEWHDRSLGVVTRGISELYLREVWDDLPVKPSLLSLGMTFPLPSQKLRDFAAGIKGPLIVLEDGYRFVQEELLHQGIPAEGKSELEATTEWSPAAVVHRLGAHRLGAHRLGAHRLGAHRLGAHRLGARPSGTGPTVTGVDLEPPAEPVRRPPTLCAGCPYRAFGLSVARLRKKKKIIASFGDIGCNTLLYFMKALDTCLCMGASDAQRQGVVLADPSLAGRTISVIGDSTECHSGLDATRNALFRHIPGVKVVLDNFTTAMTGGQSAPTSPKNLAGQSARFDLVKALQAEGALVEEVDAYDLKAVEATLTRALAKASEGAFSVLVLRGSCIMEVPSIKKQTGYALIPERCTRCNLCFVCPGIEKDETGLPRFNHQCANCGGHEAVCVQRCNLKAFEPIPKDRRSPPLQPAEAELPVEEASRQTLPKSLRVAIRGVGGQGNLFLGKVLAEVALLMGFVRLIKGETHGMAQMGGAVLSTFGCGEVFSPVPAPASTDVLIALEESEVLRPGFLELLKEDGVILLNRLHILPAGLAEEDYPSASQLEAFLKGRDVISFDGMALARSHGDSQGRTLNVIALGLLSTVAPFSAIPYSVWLEALQRLSPSEPARAANRAAFLLGRRERSSSQACQPSRRGFAWE